MKSSSAAGVLTVALMTISGCGYSEQELDAAYRDGHRSGIIWCKRLGEPQVPELDEVLLQRWKAGFVESTSIQCKLAASELQL